MIITAEGFQPPSVTILGGQSVHWTNELSQTQNMTADDGLFASGDIPPGGGFSIAIAIPGIHYYTSTVSSAHGQLRVGYDALSGPDGDLAAAHIPDIPFPGADPTDIGVHPLFGIKASRTRLLLGFKPSATVAQANAALRGAGVILLGGLPDLGLLLVVAPDTPDFSGLLAAQRSLRSDAAVSLAALSTVAGDNAVPRQAESDIEA
ncbi:MAG: hypothetical protein M1482_15680, partial [Chloroflexi bacterium]|nr:hypothetical protein [Chloroflexota bacterium]